MIQSEIEVLNKLGVHARVASKLVKAASKYQSEITLAHGDQSASVKSIMGLMMLAATHGSKLLLTVSGDDEEVAHKAICDLFLKRFGEED